LRENGSCIIRKIWV